MKKISLTVLSFLVFMENAFAIKTDVKKTDIVYKIKTFVDDNILNGGVMVLIGLTVISVGIWNFVKGNYVTLLVGFIGLAMFASIYSILDGVGMMI